MSSTLRALSALLAYPTEELREAIADIGTVLVDDGLVSARERADLWPLLAELRNDDLYELQERYVELFDRSRSLTLNLFEHVHGESRDRGQAMVDLAALYEQGGLTMTANELPDYLPLLLEYASTRPASEARQLLADIAPIVAALRERLVGRGSTYAGVFGALLALSGSANAEPVELAEPVDIDTDWAEDPVAFGPEAAPGCSSDRTMSRIRAARRDPRIEETNHV